ncbi:hypothetical protein LY78DRAFT_210768 [Colletotrichum sublineola]|nr:hypothetical protein LY78DRAFT_210768 [Colletotrichum sublineola]
MAIASHSRLCLKRTPNSFGIRVCDAILVGCESCLNHLLFYFFYFFRSLSHRHMLFRQARSTIAQPLQKVGSITTVQKRSRYAEQLEIFIMLFSFVFFFFPPSQGADTRRTGDP